MPTCPSCHKPNDDHLALCDHCGADLAPARRVPPPSLSPDLQRQLLELLAQDRKIEAIKLHRESTGSGLKQAKDAVEALAAGAPSELTPEIERRLLELLTQNRKIEAIKLHRDTTGSGLKQSKDAVEALAARHGIQPSPASSGCLGVMLLFVVALAAALAFPHLVSV